MSDIVRFTPAPQARESLAVVRVSRAAPIDAALSQKSGNELPLDGKAANVRRLTDSETQKFQQDVKEAVTQMNEYAQSSLRDLSFRYDADRGETIVQVVDRETQEVIRQIPDAVFLKIAQQLAEEAPGALLSAQV